MRRTPSFLSAGLFRFFLARVFTKTPIPQFTGTSDRLRSHLLVCVPSLRSLPLPPAPAITIKGPQQRQQTMQRQQATSPSFAVGFRLTYPCSMPGELHFKFDPLRSLPFVRVFSSRPTPRYPSSPHHLTAKTHDDSDGRCRGSELHQLSIRCQLQPPLSP